MHHPVLLHEVIGLLAPAPGEFFVDGTVDGGGHAEAIIRAIGPSGTFFGLDWDERLLAECAARLKRFPNATFAHGNYADLPSAMRERKLGNANGLLIDLGFSSEQLDTSGRGFSFEKDEPLLMTYDDERTPVYEILKREHEAALADIIFQFGGERFSRRIAKAIKEELRHGARIMTSGALAAVVRKAVPGRGRLDPATKTFQALRIYANGELENLEKLLAELPKILAPGGRVAIITFHSLEDGIVKRAFRDYAKEGTMTLINKKPIEASWEEIKANPRSRSAKVRAAVMQS